VPVVPAPVVAFVPVAALPFVDIPFAAVPELVLVVGAPLVTFSPFVVEEPPAAELAALLAPLPVGPCAPEVSLVPDVVVVVVVLPPVFVAAPFAAYGSAFEPAFAPVCHATIMNTTITIATPAASA
jgi:hypothetical protein